MKRIWGVRIVSIAIVVVLFAVLLSGCASTDLLPESTESGGTQSSQDQTPTLPNSTGNAYNVNISSSPIPENSSQTTADIVERVRDSVVEIYATLAEGSSSGSGVIVGLSEEENYVYILTCLHVVEDATEVKVRLTSGTEKNALFVGGNPQDDIAVIKIEKPEHVCIATVRDTEQSPVRIGESAIAIGNALGTLGGTVTKGIISATERTTRIEGYSMTLLQTDAAINGGNSGGALFDEYGLLIGIVNAKVVLTEVEGIGYAIPVATAVQNATALIETAGNSQYNGYGYIEGQKLLGITTVAYTENSTSNYLYQISDYQNYGSLSPYILNGTVKTGDYIVMVDGKQLTDATTFDTLMQEKSIGDSVTLTLRRYGYGMFAEPTEYDVTFPMRQYVYGYIPTL